MGAAEFASLTETAGLFEQRPRLAVAVSGGPDSLCLCLLAAGWAAAQDGAASALIVDHGLRPESAAEARQVAAWLRARRIDHHVLRWAGAKPASGIQAAAREARYRLLGDWCRVAGILHLLLGHHLDDQAETVALRQARGAAPKAWPAWRRYARPRRIAPAAPVPRGAEGASAGDSGGAGAAVAGGSEQPCTVVRARVAAPQRGWMRHASPGARHSRRGGVPRTMSRWRFGLPQRAHRPGGLRPACRRCLWPAPPEIRRRAVQRAVMTVGGNPYPPRQARLERLLQQLRAGLVSGRTLAGCRVLPWRGELLICREAQAIEEEALLTPGVPLRWDGRFLPRAERHARNADGAAARPSGHARPRRREPGAAGAGVRPSLPSLWRRETSAVPHRPAPTLACAARYDHRALQPGIATRRSAVLRTRSANIETVASARRDLMR